MKLNQKYSKIDKTLKKNKRKSLGIFNNLIAGIITGTFVGSSFSYFVNFLINLQIISLIFYSLIMGFVLYIYFKVGLWAVRNSSKDFSEDYNYYSNFLAGFVGSLVSSIVLILKLKTLFFIPLLVLILIVVVYKFAKVKRI